MDTLPLQFSKIWFLRIQNQGVALVSCASAMRSLRGKFSIESGLPYLLPASDTATQSSWNKSNHHLTTENQRFSVRACWNPKRYAALHRLSCQWVFIQLTGFLCICLFPVSEFSMEWGKILTFLFPSPISVNLSLHQSRAWESSQFALSNWKAIQN